MIGRRPAPVPGPSEHETQLNTLAAAHAALEARVDQALATIDAALVLAKGGNRLRADVLLDVRLALRPAEVTS